MNTDERRYPAPPDQLPPPSEFAFAFPPPYCYNNRMAPNIIMLRETEKKQCLITCRRKSVVSRHGNCCPEKRT